MLKVTGICRPEDVTPANTVLSSQLHDLKIEKMHKGELKEAAEPGLTATGPGSAVVDLSS